MIMAVRIALLILVTGSFASLWSNDQPDQIAESHRSSQTIESPEDRGYDDPVPDLVAEPVPAAQEFAAATSSRPDVRVLMIPLPENITEGRYLIADRFGRSVIRTVSPEDVIQHALPQRAKIADHYDVTIGTARWHYIRLDSSVPTQLAINPDSLGAGG